MARQMFGEGDVSFYRIAQAIRIKQTVGDEKGDQLVARLSPAQFRQLAEIARIDQPLARTLADTPAEITPAYRQYRSAIASLKRKRVSARERIKRAWPAYWQRWLEKFDPADWDYVRAECRDLISVEIAELSAKLVSNVSPR
jgi:hypothetical protein